MTNSCLDCVFAEWERTKAGHLHPSADGRCTFPIQPIVLPRAFYFVGGIPAPAGGWINRKEPKTDCPMHREAQHGETTPE